MDRLAFNLLFNATCSFIAGLLVVTLALKLFRINEGRWKVYFLSLPFLKIIFDLAGGVPSDSILHSVVDPFTLPPRSQMLQIGAGFSHLGPILEVILSARTPNGREYSISLADYFQFWLANRFGELAVVTLLTFAVLVSLGLLIRRAIAWWKFESARREARLTDRVLEVRSVGWRKVDVYASTRFVGTPFTGGILKPFICVPEETLTLLTKAELEAAIAHEMAHVQSYDVVINIAIAILGDTFWFVPGYRRLKTKIERLREILADTSAVAKGVSPAHLASALVRLQEQQMSDEPTGFYSALFREPALLKTRVQGLLNGSEPMRSRLGWNFRYVRPLIAVWTTGAVILATLGGNHALSPRPVWLNEFMNLIGM